MEDTRLGKFPSSSYIPIDAQRAQIAKGRTWVLVLQGVWVEVFAYVLEVFGIVGWSSTSVRSASHTRGSMANSITINAACAASIANPAALIHLPASHTVPVSARVHPSRTRRSAHYIFSYKSSSDIEEHVRMQSIKERSPLQPSAVVREKGIVASYTNILMCYHSPNILGYVNYYMLECQASHKNLKRTLLVC